MLHPANYYSKVKMPFNQIEVIVGLATVYAVPARRSTYDQLDSNDSSTLHCHSSSSLVLVSGKICNIASFER
jgi:hypothetical protein